MAGKIPLRKTARLGFGDYARTDPETSDLVWRTRLRLMKSVHRVYPKFLDTLATEVLPKYSGLAEAGFDFDEILWMDQAFGSGGGNSYINHSNDCMGICP